MYGCFKYLAIFLLKKKQRNCRVSGKYHFWDSVGIFSIYYSMGLQNVHELGLAYGKGFRVSAGHSHQTFALTTPSTGGYCISHHYLWILYFSYNYIISVGIICLDIVLSLLIISFLLTTCVYDIVRRINRSITVEIKRSGIVLTHLNAIISLETSQASSLITQMMTKVDLLSYLNKKTLQR